MEKKHQLTKRENDVLELIAKGLLYKEIADMLYISLDTVKKHTKNIYKKLGVRNRTEATNQYQNKKTA
jgi:two-component system, NarL family, response regulator LiaR